MKIETGTKILFIQSQYKDSTECSQFKRGGPTRPFTVGIYHRSYVHWQNEGGKRGKGEGGGGESQQEKTK